MEEIWKKVTHYDLAYDVEVSNLGNLRKISDEKIHNFSISPNSRGYFNVRLYHTDGLRYNHTAHRLVAITFLGFNENKVINHIDGNTLNNNVSNLEWVTISENCLHSKGITRYKKTKEFTDIEILAMIKDYLENVIPLNEFAKKYNVTRGTIRILFNVKAKRLLTLAEYENLRLIPHKNRKYGRHGI